MFHSYFINVFVHEVRYFNFVHSINVIIKNVIVTAATTNNKPDCIIVHTYIFIVLITLYTTTKTLPIASGMSSTVNHKLFFKTIWIKKALRLPFKHASLFVRGAGEWSLIAYHLCHFIVYFDYRLVCMKLKWECRKHFNWKSYSRR